MEYFQECPLPPIDEKGRIMTSPRQLTEEEIQSVLKAFYL